MKKLLYLIIKNQELGRNARIILCVEILFLDFKKLKLIRPEMCS